MHGCSSLLHAILSQTLRCHDLLCDSYNFFVMLAVSFLESLLIFKSVDSTGMSLVH